MEDQFFSVLTRCRRFQILVTNISPNDFKLHMDTPKRLYSEVGLVINVEFLVAGSSRAAKSGKNYHEVSNFSSSIV